MDDYIWETDEELANNTFVMTDYLDHHMPDTWNVNFTDGTYAEVTTDTQEKYALHASGNGDFFNHKITFEAL